MAAIVANTNGRLAIPALAGLLVLDDVITLCCEKRFWDNFYNFSAIRAVVNAPPSIQWCEIYVRVPVSPELLLCNEARS